MIMDLRPGRIIEIDGVPHYVESVRLDILAQRIEPLASLLAKNEQRDFEDWDFHSPCFTRLQGDLDDPMFQSPKLKVLFPEGEAE